MSHALERVIFPFFGTQLSQRNVSPRQPLVRVVLLESMTHARSFCAACEKHSGGLGLYEGAKIHHLYHSITLQVSFNGKPLSKTWNILDGT